MAASTMTTAPFSFTLDVPIVVAADLDGDAVTLRTDSAAIQRDVAAALRRLADSIAPAAAEHLAIAEARAGRPVALMLGTLRESEYELATLADTVDPDLADYRRVNGDHRLTFPNGGSIIAVDEHTIRGRSFDSIVIDRRALERPSIAALMDAIAPALATSPYARILTI